MGWVVWHRGARGGKEKRKEAKKGWIDLGHTHTQLAKTTIWQSHPPPSSRATG